MVASVSFLELGQFPLTTELAWTPLAIVRTHDVIDKVDGGWSAMARLMLEDLLFGPLGLSVAGLPIKLPSGNIVLHAELRNVLADGDGLRQFLAWKGSSSFKPCFVHYNVLKKNSETEHDWGDEYCDITCHELEKFRRWPDSELDKVVLLMGQVDERVEAGTLSRARAEDIRKVSGLSWSPHCALASDLLRGRVSFIGSLTYDWVHTALQDGCFVLEASLVVQACGEHVEASPTVWNTGSGARQCTGGIAAHELAIACVSCIQCNRRRCRNLWSLFQR